MSILDNLGPEEIVITKHGSSAAHLIPAASGYGNLIGSMKDRITVTGDIEPTGVVWNAQCGRLNLDAHIRV